MQREWPFATQAATGAAKKRMVVFGSNLGWQAFFMHLTYGVPVDGFEIVEHRYAASVAFAKENEMPDVRFSLEDATKANIPWAEVRDG